DVGEGVAVDVAGGHVDAAGEGRAVGEEAEALDAGGVVEDAHRRRVAGGVGAHHQVGGDGLAGADGEARLKGGGGHRRRRGQQELLGGRQRRQGGRRRRGGERRRDGDGVTVVAEVGVELVAMNDGGGIRRGGDADHAGLDLKGRGGPGCQGADGPEAAGAVVGPLAGGG